ncbi:Sulfhydryl oxidase [Pandoravirus neocaledonia]|uniref:Sulfhydryl oxidase n=1 Tax=Pandoravirus neocaledonia TaxID=2107708 RepID=A0A2U7UC78_9VIRU|nr:Sulfhydryl oxidase [Pandoravirus neocaledonia]AVK75930.1 Sulfhydryl oxidase [Pandoravirus neocaledonia]
MDTQMWGPLVWDLLAVAGRAVDDMPVDPTGAVDGPRRRATRAFVLLAYSLRHVLPCSFCRTSYRHYIEDTPPAEFVDGSDEAARARALGAAPDGAPLRRYTLVDWVWLVHDRVNRKLGVRNMLTRPRFRKRLRVTAALVHPSAVWDLLTIVALNYPVEEVGAVVTGASGAAPARDPDEQRAKRTGHVVFLDALSRLLPLVPDLGSVAPYIDPRRALLTGALVARDPFVSWVRTEKRAWMRDVGADSALCARMVAAERAYMASVA